MSMERPSQGPKGTRRPRLGPYTLGGRMRSLRLLQRHFKLLASPQNFKDVPRSHQKTTTSVPRLLQ